MFISLHFFAASAWVTERSAAPRTEMTPFFASRSSTAASKSSAAPFRMRESSSSPPRWAAPPVIRVWRLPAVMPQWGVISEFDIVTETLSSGTHSASAAICR